MKAARAGEQLDSRHIRHPEVGDDQRDRPACSAQTFEDLETGLRASRREEFVIPTVPMLHVPGQACQHALVIRDEQAGR